MLQNHDGINLGLIQLFHVCKEKSHLQRLIISLKVGVVVKVVEEKLKELEEKKILDG